MNVVEYQQSIAAEFKALKDRVRYFIEDAHWGEDGRYKEIILSNFLKTVLPNNVEVGTGFVRNNDGQLTSQIDIIIYNKDYPVLFRHGDFVVLMPESVLGIIEVKSKTTPFVLVSQQSKMGAIEKCERNGKIIGKKTIFNGIWGFDTDIKIKNSNNRGVRRQLKECQGYLNHICFDSNLFCRYWEDGNIMDRYFDARPCYSFYNLSCKPDSGLAYGYFISNLLEYIYRQNSPEALSKQYFHFLYPLENTKEEYRYENCDVKLDLPKNAI